MFVNRLNQLYKPERTLFYIDIESDDIEAFTKGEISDDIGKYSNAFGTYDAPGLFYLDSFEKPVLGIEYRIGDERISYPEGLKTVTLKGAYFYSVEVDSDIKPELSGIKALFNRIAADDDAHRLYNDLSICEKPQVISIFPHDDKLRILHEWKLDKARAQNVILDNIDGLEKEFLYNMAFRDPITRNYNWNHLVPFLEMPKVAGINDFVFVHFDIKEFRVLNTTYGHIAANRVLKKVMQAMKDADFVYASGRCHEDNFAMIIKDMPEDELIEKLEGFFESISGLDEDPNHRISYRCGVVPMRRSLLLGNRVADAAKSAQKMGKESYKTDIVIYTDKMHDEERWGNYIKAYVDTAIKNDEFEVYLQPKYDIHTEKIKGAEALIRWRYKGGKLLSPYRFIPFFEKDGSIAKIDDIVLQKVCEALAGWKQNGYPPYPISVNLSRSRLYEKGLVERLEETVDSFGVDHSLIDFELTESASYDNKQQMINVLDKLRDKGFSISMDDFGTGYSSLSLLTEIPIDTLKIDKSFVDKAGAGQGNAKDIIVLRYIISLAKELGYVCLAEGAETREQVERLKGLGCDVIQGYYFSKPVPMKEYEEKIKTDTLS